MNINLEDAFERIKADEALKNNTYAFLKKQISSQEGKRRNIKSPRLVYIVSAIVCSAFLCLFAHLLYFTETTYISMDVNPSVELGLNRFDWVISVEAFNGEGASMIDALPLKNKSYTDAIKLLVESEAFYGYINENALLLFTVQTDHPEKEELVLKELKHCVNGVSAKVECHSVDSSLLKQAKKNGMSAGKYQVFLELQRLDSTIMLDECKNLTMGELRDRIDACHENNSNSQGHGHKHGQHGK